MEKNQVRVHMRNLNLSQYMEQNRMLPRMQRMLALSCLNDHRHCGREISDDWRKANVLSSKIIEL